AEILAFTQNRDPRQPGLKPIENEFFEQRAIVIFRHTPFGVAIGDIEWVFAGPRAAQQTVGMQHCLLHIRIALAARRISSGAAMVACASPAAIDSPASSASCTRSIRNSASARPSADDPSVPSGLPSAVTGAPASGIGPSINSRTVRVR